jgi:outer membrane protein assembly factor BamA
MVAVRVGGEKIFGDFPFYEAAYIGGPANVRGFRENRFAGDAAAFGNAELRLKLTKIRLVFPWEFGIHGLADAGRVWFDGDDDAAAADSDYDKDKLHTAVGGGIWLSILNRTQTISLSVANSDEETLIYFKAGFHF